MDENDYVTAIELLFEEARQVRRRAQVLCAGLAELHAAAAFEPAGDPGSVDETIEAQLEGMLGRYAVPARIPGPRARYGSAPDEE